MTAREEEAAEEEAEAEAEARAPTPDALGASKEKTPARPKFHWEFGGSSWAEQIRMRSMAAEATPQRPQPPAAAPPAAAPPPAPPPPTTGASAVAHCT